MSFCLSSSRLYVSTHLGKMRWPKIGWVGWIFPWKLNDTKVASTFDLRETEIPIFNEKINGISSHYSRASRPERRLLFNSRNWTPQLLRSWKGSKMWWTYLHKDVGKKNNMVNDGSWSMPRHGWLICYWRMIGFSVVPHVNGYNSARTSWDYQSWQVTQNEAPI